MKFFGSRSRFGSQSAQTQSSSPLKVPSSVPSGTLLRMSLTPGISISPMQESKSSLFIPSSQPLSQSDSSSVPLPPLPILKENYKMAISFKSVGHFFAV